MKTCQTPIVYMNRSQNRIRSGFIASYMPWKPCTYTFCVNFYILNLLLNTLRGGQSHISPHYHPPKRCVTSHVTPSNATTNDTMFKYGYRRFYRCIVRFLWVVGAKVPWSSNWASKHLRNRKMVNFFNTWPVLSTSWNILALTVPFAAAPSCIVWQI